MSQTEETLEGLAEISQAMDTTEPDPVNTEKDVEQPKVEDAIFQEMKNLVSDLEDPVPTPPPVEEPQPNKEEVSTNEETPEEEANDVLESNPQINMEDLNAAHEEMNEVDVMVCGGCHSVYHFVEDLTRHKSQCKKKSSFRNNVIEMKPQVWAFLLWKNAQGKVTKRGITIEESSWRLYQKWCKMPERIRSAWVAAGEAVMTYTTFGNKQPEAPAQPTKIVKQVTKEVLPPDDDKPVILRKLVQRDHLGEIKEIRSTDDRPEPKTNTLKEDIENIRNQLEGNDTVELKSAEGVQNGGGTFTEEEFVVEKIVSRRFNPKKKQYEYLLKWEGYPPEQNTWEPAENLEACQHLLKSFEESLAKQSFTKQRTKKQQQQLSNINQEPPTPAYVGRPVRYSKQKALSQVKQWCGSIKPDELEIESGKRKMGLDSDDSDDFLTKKIKSELESDSEENLHSGGKILFTKAGGTSGIVKRVGRVGRPPKNPPAQPPSQVNNLAAALGLESSGDESDNPLAILSQQRNLNSKVSNLSPLNQQVLVANAKGVLKVDPSQVPNLTSGVYIMSNKSIVKLDSVTPSKAIAINEKQNNSKQHAIQPQKQSQYQITNNGQVMMVRNGGGGSGVGGGQKSGIIRKNPGILKQPTPRPQGAIRFNSTNNPNRLQSGIVARSAIGATTSGIRPRGGFSHRPSSIPKKMESEKKILGSKSTGRGGLKSGIHRKTLLTKEELENKLKDLKNGETDIFEDFPETESSESDVGTTDDFPKDLPPPTPDSPPRPLTLCPLTGKVLSRAEGEKTPEPTPPPSPDKKEEAHAQTSQLKEEAAVAYLNPIEPEAKALFVNTNAQSSEINRVVTKVTPAQTQETATIVPDSEDDMVTITGEDGLVYKVSNSDLGTLLGEEGEQCVYVTEGDDEGVLALASQYQQQNIAQVLNGEGEATEYLMKEGDEELVAMQQSDDQQGQVVAQLVEAGEPAPGGLRRVVLLLPDGNLMMTEVDEEQYAALELDK